MLITVIILSIILLISVGINIYFGLMLNSSYDKIEKCESMIDSYEVEISNFHESLVSTLLKLKELDNKQIFEKDDEVGFVFSEIIKLIEEIKTKYDHKI